MSSNDTPKNEVMRDRAFSFVDAKTISLPVAGTFPATCFSVALIGTYTSRFTKNGDVTYKDYERVGLGFTYLDKNTGEIQEVFTEMVLTNKRKSRFHSAIVAMLGSDENFAIKNLVGTNAFITVTHKNKTDKDGKETSDQVANISLIEAMPDGADVGVDATDKHIFFDFVTDYSVDGTDQMKLLPRKHLWFIENRSNEYGKNPLRAPANDATATEVEQPKQDDKTG